MAERKQPELPTETMSPSEKKSNKTIAICCGVTATILIIILVTIVVLFLTILKPKQPQILAHPVNLTHIRYGIFPAMMLELTLALEVTIVNRNYGSFKYHNTTAYLYYHGDDVGEAPIKGYITPARGKQNVSSIVNVEGDKMLLNPSFIPDFTLGVFNFSSLTTMHGKVSVFKVLRMHATAHSTCDISVSMNAHTAHYDPGNLVLTLLPSPKSSSEAFATQYSLVWSKTDLCVAFNYQLVGFTN